MLSLGGNSYLGNEVEFLKSYRTNSLYFYKQMQGIIKKLTDKNFGFITVEGEDKDLFFHANELDGVSFDELREGDAVTFEINEESPKGPSATQVKKA